MMNPDMHVVANLDPKKITMTPTRNGFGEGLVEAANINPTVVGVCADLTESTRMQAFKDEFPDRFIQIGVSEQLLVAMGAGLAMAGKTPVITSYAMFCPGRAWEQVRTNVCLNDVNVKIIGSHAGVSVGPDGATHQAVEDIAITRCLPRMTIVVPADAIQARKATVAIINAEGPAYLRLGREKTWVFTTPETPFTIGKAQILRQGTDVAIIACGILVYNALRAAEELAKEGMQVMVVNNHTIKPMDNETIIEAAKTCGAVVTVEEHQVHGGMGSLVAETLGMHHPVPMEMIGVQDTFGQSGDPMELIAHYGMDIPDIINAAKRAYNRK